MSNWQEVGVTERGLRHAAFAVFERPNLAAMAYLLWDADRGWYLSVRIEAMGKAPVDAGHIGGLAGPDDPAPAVGPITLAMADALAERATRGDGGR